MKCPNCNETHHDSHAKYYNKREIILSYEKKFSKDLKKERTFSFKKRESRLLVFFIALLFVSICLLESFSVQQTGHPYEKEIKSALKEYFYYWDNNLYERLMHMFWYDVDRFQNEKNISREKVILLIKRDKANSGIISSTSRPRWNTMTIKNLPYEGFSIVFLEDYEIERTDKNKATKFVLENHVEMDQYFNITSIYQRTVSSK